MSSFIAVVAVLLAILSLVGPEAKGRSLSDVPETT